MRQKISAQSLGKVPFHAFFFTLYGLYHEFYDQRQGLNSEKSHRKEFRVCIKLRVMYVRWYYAKNFPLKFCNINVRYLEVWCCWIWMIAIWVGDICTIIFLFMHCFIWLIYICSVIQKQIETAENWNSLKSFINWFPLFPIKCLSMSRCLFIISFTFRSCFQK